MMYDYIIKIEMEVKEMNYLKGYLVEYDDGTAGKVPASLFKSRYCRIDIYGLQAILERVKHTRKGKKMAVRAIYDPDEKSWVSQL